jgi:DNA helicase IV
VTSSTDEIEHEQSYVDHLYARLDQLRARTADELATVRRTVPSGTHQNRSERDSFATLHEHRLAQLMAVEDRLAFGRLDLTSGTSRYVGRLGLSDDEQTQLLVDWRAPAARSFYQATAASPGDVVRRRHLATRARTVVGVEDEVLDLDQLDGDQRATLSGEGALLAAVGSARTGRMADIVATIQSEQDRVIRSELAGVLVVQGGPGTGKTAVALHRAAYLLYTHRERLARTGVLVVGPNTLFLRYIEQVLPSLGETGVVMSTPGELFPGVEGVTGEPDDVAALKGDPRMARVVARAVRERQRVPDTVRMLNVDTYRIELRPEVVANARGRARRTRKPHNAAREGYLKDLLQHLAGQLADAMRTELTSDNREDLVAELRDSADVRRELNLTWMPLTPEQLLRDLFASPEALEACAPDLAPEERSLLRRQPDAPWTVADVPLLDEAAELLGEDDTATRLAARRAAAERAAEIGYARATLQSAGAGGDLVLPAWAAVSAEQLADRFADSGPSRSVAERAESDRSWAFGHVVVDEAQELSPMMWRLLMRRNPARSMTLVGDVAQVGSAAGTSSWDAALRPYVQDRWHLESLTVNYRTPAAIMRVASAVLAGAGVSAPTPQSVREGDAPPQADTIPPGLDVGEVAALEAVRAVVAAEVDAVDRGRLAVVGPEEVVAAVRPYLRDTMPPGTIGEGRRALDSPVVVLTVHDVKGLEFDSVVLLEPAAILKASPRGANDLYVALTRPTQRLRVLASGDLPTGLDTLRGT